MEPDLDRFTSRRSTVYASEGIVATSQPLAAEAGRDLLRDGGNAFDAAVATAAALNVVEPTSTGLVAGDTGIALQNRGASFSLDPEDPNRLEPGKRPFHTLVPALARFDEDDWAAFGVMGRYMQPQGHVQILSNLVDYGMPLQRALDEPRWRYRADGTLGVEERLPDGVAPQLARRGHDIRVEPAGAFGGAQIARFEDGSLSAATDPRKDGQVAPY